MEQDRHKIPENILTALKRNIDKVKNDTEKPKAFSQAVNMVGMGELTVSQLKSLKSFFDNYAPSDQEQKEKWNLLTGNQLRAWVNNTLDSIRTKEKQSKKMKRFAGFDNVYKDAHSKDTSNTISTTSTAPPKVTSYNSNDIFEQEVREIQRLIRLLS